MFFLPHLVDLNKTAENWQISAKFVRICALPFVVKFAGCDSRAGGVHLSWVSCSAFLGFLGCLVRGSELGRNFVFEIA